MAAIIGVLCPLKNDSSQDSRCNDECAWCVNGKCAIRLLIEGK